jgi:hypothetical protein
MVVSVGIVSIMLSAAWLSKGCTAPPNDRKMLSGNEIVWRGDEEDWSGFGVTGLVSRPVGPDGAGPAQAPRVGG